MNIKNIIQEYMENPEEVYDKLSSMDEQSRNAVYFIEEIFTWMKLSGINEVSDEQYIAELVDKIRSGEFRGDLELKDIEAIQDVIISIEKMSNDVKREVPEVLMSVIDRTLKVTDKKQIPSFIVRLTADGIKTIMSGINGMSLVPVTNPVMRSQATLNKESDNIQIEQLVDGNKISYNILKESDDDIMLAMNFPDKIGRCRILLKDNERILYTENLNDGENSVGFRKLKPGYYDISITGFINHSFGILVDNLNRS